MKLMCAVAVVHCPGLFVVETNSNWILPSVKILEGSSAEVNISEGALPLPSVTIRIKASPNTLHLILPDGQTLDALLKVFTGSLHKFAVGVSLPVWRQITPMH